MFSVIYTPTEGDAIQNYSRLFRKPQGCFLNINDIGRVHEDLAQWGSAEDIDYIVVTGVSIYPIPNPTTLLTSPRWRGDPRNWRPRRRWDPNLSSKAGLDNPLCWRSSQQNTGRCS